MLPSLSFFFSFAGHWFGANLAARGKCCSFRIGVSKRNVLGPGAFSWVAQRGPELPSGATSGLAGCIDVLDVRTQNGDEPVGEITFPGQSCLSSANSC